MDKNRLLTDEEFIKLRPAFAGVDKIVLQAQDLKSVKAVIEEIEDRYLTECRNHRDGDFVCDNCDYIESNKCRWQQFKERNGIK